VEADPAGYRRRQCQLAALGGERDTADEVDAEEEVEAGASLFHSHCHCHSHSHSHGGTPRRRSSRGASIVTPEFTSQQTVKYFLCLGFRSEGSFARDNPA